MLLALAACTPRPETGGAPSVTVGDPPIHLHPHPDVAPDELGNAAASGGRGHAAAGDDSGRAAADAGRGRAAASARAATPAPADDAGACSPRETPPRATPPVRIASGPPITNSIPPAVIMRPIRERAACLRDCYDAGLARDPSIEGRLVVKLVVDADGWVRTVRVLESELGDRETDECVRRELVGLHYPPIAGGARISVVYPMTFRR